MCGRWQWASEVEVRATGRVLAADSADSFAHVLAPQQLAVGISGGISVLVFGVRCLLELHPGFVVVRLDLRNGFNAVARAAMLRRMAEQPRLAHLVPFMHALLHAPTDLFVSVAERLFGGAIGGGRGDSHEGTQQGFAVSSGAFSVAIQPELRALDEELATYGGSARAIMDDGYAVGPPEVVFPALERFAASLLEMTQACRSSRLNIPAGPPSTTSSTARGGAVWGRRSVRSRWARATGPTHTASWWVVCRWARTSTCGR